MTVCAELILVLSVLSAEALKSVSARMMGSYGRNEEKCGPHESVGEMDAERRT